MKTKFYWVALLASAALIAQAKAGGHHEGGGGFAGGGHAIVAGGGAHASQVAPRGSFGAGRFMAPGPRFSSYRSPTAFGQQHFAGSDHAFAGSRQFGPAMTSRHFGTSRTFNQRENRSIRNGRDFGNRFENRGLNGARDHVFARRSADWHRDWNRGRDHWWDGHRCRFVNGAWFIYDFGFDPYYDWNLYGYRYGYPYYGYAYDSYPYGYSPAVYQGDTDYYPESAYNSSDRSIDSTVALVQQQLAGQGYYRGEIDGAFGPETRRAIMRYQAKNGLGATGRLNVDTLRALGLPRVASN